MPQRMASGLDERVSGQGLIYRNQGDKGKEKDLHRLSRRLNFLGLNMMTTAINCMPL